MFRYLFIKGKLVGLYTKLPLYFFIFLIGVVFLVHAYSNITPKSVHVSGYYRSNGSYVSSYSRRPSGSRDHDAPYEVEAIIAFLVLVFGFVQSSRILWKFYAVPGSDLLPEIEQAAHIRNRRSKMNSKRYSDLRVSQAFQKESEYHSKLKDEQFKKIFGMYQLDLARPKKRNERGTQLVS